MPLLIELQHVLLQLQNKSFQAFRKNDDDKRDTAGPAETGMHRRSQQYIRAATTMRQYLRPETCRLHVHTLRRDGCDDPSIKRFRKI
jgi:hypothetical protein